MQEGLQLQLLLGLPFKDFLQVFVMAVVAVEVVLVHMTQKTPTLEVAVLVVRQVAVTAVAVVTDMQMVVKVVMQTGLVEAEAVPVGLLLEVVRWVN
jgi:hypothetical protein